MINSSNWFFITISLPIQVNANILMNMIQLSLSKNNPLEYFWKHIKETGNTVWLPPKKGIERLRDGEGRRLSCTFLRTFKTVTYSYIYTFF